MSKLVTKIINEKLEEVFNKLGSAAKINIALGFDLRRIETGEDRCFYVHEMLWSNVPKNAKTQNGESS